MSEVNTNLQSYYSTEQKANRPKNLIASPPQTLPSYHLYSDKDAEKKFNEINSDIYSGYKKEKSKPFRNFLNAFLISLAAILGIKGICKLYRFFK